MKPHSQKFLQKRRFAMVLPVLVLPFLTMMFWSLGGGQGSLEDVKSKEEAGLNLTLPDANFNGERPTKLELYNKAERDSLKVEEERKNDPYFDLAMLNDPQEEQPKQERTTRQFRNP